jgi:hypothetical protein
VLFHEATVENGLIHSVLLGLRQAGVTLKAGPRAIEIGVLSPSDAPLDGDMGVEYGDLTCLIEVSA